MDIKKTYKECGDCYNCCRTGVIAYPATAKKLVEFYTVKSYKAVRDGNRIIFYVYEPCPKLNEYNGRCGIYNKRPQTCREFPTEREIRSDWQHICPLIKKLRKKKGSNIIVDASASRVDYMSIDEEVVK